MVSQPTFPRIAIFVLCLLAAGAFHEELSRGEGTRSDVRDELHRGRRALVQRIRDQRVRYCSRYETALESTGLRIYDVIAVAAHPTSDDRRAPLPLSGRGGSVTTVSAPGTQPIFRDDVE